jgi:YHS domain-containing protein
MSWKLSTLAIALFGLVGSSLAAGGQNASWKDTGPQNDSPVVASGDASPLAAAKQSDKELIEKQKTCPVTDQPLGSMGKPVKVVVKGRTVFLCCAGCKKKLLANPDKYLKKLDEQQGEKK